MDVMQTAQRMTAEEYLALPEHGDGPRTQLVDGEVVVMSDATWLHNTVQGGLYSALSLWVSSFVVQAAAWSDGAWLAGICGVVVVGGACA